MPNDILRYEEWLYSLIELGNNLSEYGQLLLYLSGKAFTWTVKKDADRAAHGYELRRSFSDYFYVQEDFWVGKMPEPCSILEMMIALAMKCDDIIYDPKFGNRTPEWFWMMIDNLGLSGMDRLNFDKDYCDEIIERFLKRRYLRDGRGGLFRTRYSQIDMRKSEIWYQANVWLEENF